MTSDTVYAIHIVDSKGERVFTSVAMMLDDVKEIYNKVQVGGDLQKRIYDVCEKKYVEIEKMQQH